MSLLSSLLDAYLERSKHGGDSSVRSCEGGLHLFHALRTQRSRGASQGQDHLAEVRERWAGLFEAEMNGTEVQEHRGMHPLAVAIGRLLQEAQSGLRLPTLLVVVAQAHMA